MEIGDTFLGEVLCSGQHLHVVLSNASSDGCVVLVMISTYDESYKNGTCILLPSDGHPFIKRSSYVAYELAVLYPVTRLEALLNSGKIKVKESFSSDIMERILAGADKNSARISNECWIELDNQGLIPRY